MLLNEMTTCENGVPKDFPSDQRESRNEVEKDDFLTEDITSKDDFINPHRGTGPVFHKSSHYQTDVNFATNNLLGSTAEYVADIKQGCAKRESNSLKSDTMSIVCLCF